MGKKIEEAEVKKECPSCGLGVALDSTVCEFCGWDFEEEDEWILQIEKLERDLMLEKQKFEPGTVNHKIESTLHNPSLERMDIIRARQEQSASDRPEREVQAPVAKPAPAPPPSPPHATYGDQKGFREAKPSEMEFRRAATTSQAERRETPKLSPAREKETARVESAPIEPSPAKVRRVRTVKAPQADSGEQDYAKSEPAKTRLVRKVKK